MDGSILLFALKKKWRHLRNATWKGRTPAYPKPPNWRLNLHTFCCWCNFCKDASSSRPVHAANPPDLYNRERSRLLTSTSGTLFSGLDVVRPGFVSSCFPQVSCSMASIWLSREGPRLVTVSGNPAPLASGEALSCLCLLYPISTYFHCS